MKKLSFLVAFLFFSFLSTNSFSQTKEDQAIEVEEVVLDKIEIDISDLPAEISEKLDSNYIDFTVEKALKTTENGSEFFYITLSNDDERIEVIFDAEGKVLEL